MSPVALYFASGESLYVGTPLLLALVFISRWLERRWLLRLRNITAWVALAMIVMASPPLPWIIDAIFVVTFVLWLFLVNKDKLGESLRKLRIGAAVVLAALLIVVTAVELSHRAMPMISGMPCDHLVVIGDSISSGIDTRVLPWPIIMQQMTDLPVKNLAQAGARTIDAEVMADKVNQQDLLVLIEIGGNDLLAGVPANEFAKGLETTLAKLAAPRRTLVMFELPLFPQKVAFGQTQRRLSSKYGVTLIPKRYFTAVIGKADATSDGLHLSDAGSQSMAALVAKILSPVLVPAAR